MNKIKTYYNIGIDALLPIYITGKGDHTLVILKNGNKEYLNIKLRSVLSSLASILSIDLHNIKKKYSNLTGQKNRIPIPLSLKLILVPFKTRNALVKNDSCLGYINLTSIKYITKVDGTTTQLTLKNGTEIQILRSISCVKKRLAAAQLAAHHFITTTASDSIACSQVKELHKEYNQPATKADVAYISNKLNQIIYRLGLD